MTSRWARMRRLVCGLGLALALIAAPAPRAAAVPPAKAGTPRRVPTIYYRARSFRIPFKPFDAQDRARLKEVQLWVSDDSGYNWRAVGRTTPDRPAFTFKAPRDAEFWFAVRTLDIKNRLYPLETAEVQPDMKVVVDTNPPSIVLDPETRRGSVVEVRWEVRDEYVDLASQVLEYQVQGETEWRQAPLRRPALIGAQRWDSGTLGAVRVRLSVADRAGNVSEEGLVLPASDGQLVGGGLGEPPDGLDEPFPDFEGNRPTFAPASAPASRRPDLEAEGMPAPGPNPLAPAPAAAQEPAPAPAPAPVSTPTPAASDDPELFVAPTPIADPGPALGNDPGAAAFEPSGEPQAPAAPAPAAPPAAAAAATPAAGQTRLTSSPRFALHYAVDDAGPGGPATVELWVTQDGGRTWSRRDEDTDRTSPYLVDLGGEGTFGLSLVARGASGLGDQPPAPGDPPQMWVEVDATAPQVQLEPVVVGTAASAGKVLIAWRASDLHLDERPVVISYRPDQPGARWVPITQRLENTGKFVWAVPPSVPARFHIRVDVLDKLGNRGSAETTTNGPVIVDRTRPRSRILRLDPVGVTPR